MFQPSVELYETNQCQAEFARREHPCLSKPQNHSIHLWSHIIVSGFCKYTDGYGLVEVCHLCSPNKILYLQMFPIYIYPSFSVDTSQSHVTNSSGDAPIYGCWVLMQNPDLDILKCAWSNWRRSLYNPQAPSEKQFRNMYVDFYVCVQMGLMNVT